MPVKLVRYGVIGVGLAAAALGAPSFAASVVVDSTTDIFLASQPNGASITGYFGSDTAPGNSPVLLAVTGGATLTFSAIGSTSVDGSCFAGPDGNGCYSDESGFSPSPASGTYKGPADALIGVFLDDSVTDVSNGPASLDYTDSANLNLVSNMPGLGQIFFIGDGLTDTAVVQQFLAPTGATRLFLAVADSYGSSTGNSGSLAVTYTGAVEPVPEPASWALTIGGLGFIGAAMRRRTLRVAQAI